MARMRNILCFWKNISVINSSSNAIHSAIKLTVVTISLLFRRFATACRRIEPPVSNYSRTAANRHRINEGLRIMDDSSIPDIFSAPLKPNFPPIDCQAIAGNAVSKSNLAAFRLLERLNLPRQRRMTQVVEGYPQFVVGSVHA